MEQVRHSLIYYKDGKLIVRSNVSDITDCPKEEMDLLSLHNCYDACPCGCEMEVRREIPIKDFNKIGLEVTEKLDSI